MLTKTAFLLLAVAVLQRGRAQWVLIPLKLRAAQLGKDLHLTEDQSQITLFFNGVVFLRLFNLKVLSGSGFYCPEVTSEYIEPKFIEDVIKAQSDASSGLNSRIVSGWDAVLGQHPHHANIRMVYSTGLVSSCGGSIVHREWMITAAHCTANVVTFVVRAGLIHLQRPEYIFEATQFWNHPSYDNSDPRRVQPNEISIMKLARPVTFSDNLKAIKIQSSADAFKNYGDLILQASGHGRTWTNGPTPETLQWVYLRGATNADCQKTYGPRIVNENTICASWYNVTSQSICQGDSGGPLLYVNEDNERILVGVSSFVASEDRGGCHSGQLAGFVRPGPFHKWFTEVSSIDFENLKEDEAPTTPYAPTTDDSEEDEVQTTTVLPPTEGEEESSSEEEVTEEPSSSEEDSSDSSESDEDESELLKRLKVKVKVKVNINKFKKKVIIKKQK